MSSPTSGGGSAKFPSREKLGRLSPGNPSGRAAPTSGIPRGRKPKSQSVENEQEKDDNVEPPSKEVPETTDKEETNADNLETDNTTQATVDGSKAEDAEKQSLEGKFNFN
ncbi:hypothetical protein D5086_011620 [Populus alba]|uniref:Uncharacterized protein n=2 Tax=Populus alba TaxID=43335 RepID=A0ACC4CEC3_POPAL|nr:hypothetical protein D5086_0000152550 [Populus alba]